MTAGELCKYEEVITKDAKTARGMVLHHKIRDRHFFEIPEKLLGRDLRPSGVIAFQQERVHEAD